MENIQQRTKTKSFFLILMIGALNVISPFSIDMYLPAFPTIAADMHVDIGKVALSVSTYFLGFAIGQILYGPLLDRFGRKPPLYFGVCLYIVASIGCTMCHSIEMLWLLRFIQALGGCVSSVAAMSMVLDFFPPEKSAAIISSLILILGVSPLLAPTVGSLIISVWNWHFVFYTLACVAALLLIMTFFFLPESHAADRSVSLMPLPIIRGFKNILLTKQFYIYALAGTFSFAGLFVYVAGSPAIFMDEFHTSPKVYGAIFAGLSVGFITTSQLNHFISKKYTNEWILRMVVIVQLAGSILFLLSVLTGLASLPLILCLLFIVLACAGLNYPNAASVALRPFTKNAGSASALLGFIQIGIGGLISAGVGALHVKGSLSTSFIMSLSTAIAFGILMMEKKKTR